MIFRIPILIVLMIFTTNARSEESVESNISTANLEIEKCKKKFGKKWVKRANCIVSVEDEYLSPLIPYKDLLNDLHNSRLKLAHELDRKTIDEEAATELYQASRNRFLDAVKERLQAQQDRREQVSSAIQMLLGGAIDAATAPRGRSFRR